MFRLGDIATVTRGLADPPSSLVREDGRPAIGVGVSMVENGNIIALGHALDAAMAGIEADLPVGLTVDKIADQPVVVEHSIHEFVKSFAEALGIVLLVSFLSLGLRTGMVVALSVPLVLAIVFFVMSLMGMDLNRITLGALDHRARAPRRRRDHRDRDDGGEDRSGLGPGAGRRARPGTSPPSRC